MIAFHHRWVSRRFGIMAVATAVGVAWSGLWVLASARTNAAFDAWVRAESLAGRTWTCPNRRIDGYPFGLHVRCTRPTFQGEVAGRAAHGVVEGFRASIDLSHPRTVAVALAGPLILRAEGGDFDLLVSWESLRVAVGLWGGGSGRRDLDATRLAVTLSVPRAFEFNARAARLSGTARPAADPDTTPADAAFGFMASGLSLPTVDDFMKNDQQLDAEGTGVLSGADRLAAPTVANLEAWRAGGGHLRIAALSITRGDFKGQASGILRLDDAHRPAGRLDTALTGFDRLAAALGIPTGGIKLGGLLTGLLGGKSIDVPGGSDAVRLPLVFEDGRVVIGPFKTPVRLDPLY